MAYLNKLKFFPQNSFFSPLFLRIDCQNCEQLDLLVWPVFDLMTSFVQVAMIGECRRTGDCARRVQRDVDAFYAPSRSRGKCAFSSRTLNFADFFKFLGPNDVTEVKPLVRKMVHSRIWITQNTQLNLKISNTFMTSIFVKCNRVISMMFVFYNKHKSGEIWLI